MALRGCRFFSSQTSWRATHPLVRRTAASSSESSLRKAQDKPTKRIRWLPDDDKTLAHFLPGLHSSRPHRRGRKPLAGLSIEAAAGQSAHRSCDDAVGGGKTFTIETRGCQMNVADSEVVRSLLVKAGFTPAENMNQADIVLVNTCAIREKAEDKVWQFLFERRAADKRLRLPRRTYALLGCMAERLKESILEHPSRLVDVVVGPDAYRHLPLLLSAVANGEPGAVGYNVQLSVDETYSDVAPLREDASKQSAFVSIARSCPMSCSFCIVPHVRGPERSRDLISIVDEVKSLVDQGVKEVTLLGQNVNSWRRGPRDSEAGDQLQPIPVAPGFGLPGVRVPTASLRFPDLLEAVASIDPEVRVRFTSPHPAHFPKDLLDLMAETPNICSSLHLPLQSGSTRVLEKMRRRYSAEAYRALVDRVKELVPGAALSTDIIVGFCGESEEDHAQTLQMLREVEFAQAFLFAYSVREKTEAARTMIDDVPHETKQNRLREAIDTFHATAAKRNERLRGTTQLVLVESRSTRPPTDWGSGAPGGGDALTGRTDGNQRVIFRDIDIPGPGLAPRRAQVGDYVAVKVTNSSSMTLFCEPLFRTSLVNYARETVAHPKLSDVAGSARQTSILVGPR